MRHVLLTVLYVAAALAFTMAVAGVLQEMDSRRKAVSVPDTIENEPTLKLRPPQATAKRAKAAG